jgi:FKBP-type peptidyl-prolyl cis-trans isomerase
MEEALALAKETEGGTIRLLSGELKSGKDGAAWHLQLFVGGEESQPKRVNLQVSAAEPKVLQRLELLTMAEDEKEAWMVLAKTQVPAEVAIQLSKDRSAGEKVEPLISEPRANKLVFVAQAGAPAWKCELIGSETKNNQIRRYEIKVNALKPRVKEKVLQDRFAGEPLRAGKPTELENGMYLFDFTIGEGEPVTADSKVKVHYRLFLLDNDKLHDTWKDKRPETFVISSAPLKGMSQGMVGMKVGGKRKIVMPYNLAFGEAGNELAPPRAMVVCDVAIEALVSE